MCKEKHQAIKNKQNKKNARKFYFKLRFWFIAVFAFYYFTISNSQLNKLCASVTVNAVFVTITFLVKICCFWLNSSNQKLYRCLEEVVIHWSAVQSTWIGVLTKILEIEARRRKGCYITKTIPRDFGQRVESRFQRTFR